MRSYRNLKKEYDALEEKYRLLLAQKSELAYELGALKDEEKQSV